MVSLITLFLQQEPVLNLQQQEEIIWNPLFWDAVYVCLIIPKAPSPQGVPPSSAAQQLARIRPPLGNNCRDCHGNSSPPRVTITSCLVRAAFDLLIPTIQIKISSTKTELGTHNRHRWRELQFMTHSFTFLLILLVFPPAPTLSHRVKLFTLVAVCFKRKPALYLFPILK